MSNHVIEKSLRQRWETHLISDKLIVELFWRKKNGTLPRPEKWWDKFKEWVRGKS